MNTKPATPPVAAQDLPPHLPATQYARFDAYLLAERLGHGGMAEVFLAVARGHKGFHKVFALKRLHAHLEQDGDAVAMFEQEARLSARLQHPNIVQTHEVGNHDGRHFMAMEYLDGQTLGQLLRALRERGERLRPELAARIAADALEGLHYAHELCDYDDRSLGLVHRDISPHNLFVTRDGHVKVLDFGIAKASFGGEHTRFGSIKGKLSYIAPEQARCEAVDRRADLWSTGVTLWEMLAGRRLFHGASDVETLRATLSEPVPALSLLAPDVPEELAQIVERALVRNPSDRYQTAQAFKLALDEWLASLTRSGARAELAQLMRSMFSEAAAQRQLALRTCIAQLDGEVLEDAARPSAVGPAHTLRGEPARRPWARSYALLALAIGCGGVAALVHHQLRQTGPVASAPASTTNASPGAQPAPGAQLAAPSPQLTPVPALAPSPAAEPKAPLPAAASPAAESRAAEAGSGRRKLTPSASPGALAPGPELAASPAETPAQDEAIAPPGFGRLRLESVPYAIVEENGERLGITPLDVPMSVGQHTLTLRSPEQGLSTTYTVSIEDQLVRHRRIALD